MFLRFYNLGVSMSCEFNGRVRVDAYDFQQTFLLKKISCEEALRVLKFASTLNPHSKFETEFSLHASDRIYQTSKPKCISKTMQKIETFLKQTQKNPKNESEEHRMRMLLGANVGFWGC
jgi:hypothetical protein